MGRLACFPHMNVKMVPARLGAVWMPLALEFDWNRYKLPVPHAALSDDTAREIADVAHCAL